MARPYKLTEKVISDLTLALSQGATYELACNYAGISYRSFRYWMKAGQELDENDDINERKLKAEEKMVLQLFQEVKKAEGKAVIKWLLLIEKQAQEGNWQAAAWKLERRYKDYARFNDDKFNEGMDWTDQITIIGLNDKAI